ncbi:MAG: hypothetical protein ABIZ49_05580 [Opitutaceae bacterium]
MKATNSGPLTIKRVTFAERAKVGHREQDRLRIKGDGRGMAAIEDFKNLRDLTAQYLANGLTAKQAKADFDRNLIVRDAAFTAKQAQEDFNVSRQARAFSYVRIISCDGCGGLGSDRVDLFFFHSSAIKGENWGKDLDDLQAADDLVQSHCMTGGHERKYKIGEAAAHHDVGCYLPPEAAHIRVQASR